MAKKKNKNTLKNKNKLAVENQKTPRHKEKYPALNFKRQVKTRLGQLETDYVDKLNEKDKAYLNSFLEETVITNFDHKGKKLYKDRKPFYDANNARNRCIYTAAQAMGTLYNASTTEALSAVMDIEAPTANNVEDAMLEAMEIKESGSWQEEELSPAERKKLIEMGVLKD
jgi:hypothetical protein